MSAGALALLARLAEASSYPPAVRAYEPDPWGYLRRKLEECEAPLRAYKQALFDRHRDALLAELAEPFLKPGSLMDHKENFEKLLPLSEFADLCFHLSPGADPRERREGARGVLQAAKPKTLFDVENLPPERRGKPWETLVADIGRRLDLERLDAVLRRGKATAFRRAMVARRLRRNLAEFLAVAHGELGAREELTLFVLTRVEAAVAACRRLVRKP